MMRQTGGHHARCSRHGGMLPNEEGGVNVVDRHYVRCILAVLPVFDAGGTANRSVRSEMLVEKLAAHGLPAVAVKDYAEAIEAVCARVAPGCAVVTMGARDPDLPKLARGILERVGSSR